MTFAQIKKYCLLFPDSLLDYPFDEDTPVFKTKGKMFALIHQVKGPVKINLKCEPLMSMNLRQTFKAVQPGYHMNKEHWNTVACDEDLEDAEIKKLISLSYELVLDKKK
jgi:predicted DNA-binding protein (MmcQ/YjbR family)